MKRKFAMLVVALSMAAMSLPTHASWWGWLLFWMDPTIMNDFT